MAVHPRGFADLTDVTLADEDTNSILTEKANRAIQGNVVMQLMQVAPSGGQICNQCQWRHLVAKFGTNTSHGVNFWVRCASGNVYSFWRCSSQEFHTWTGRILRNHGISRDGTNLFFHPGFDGIPGFFGTRLALYFYPATFWKKLVFEIMVLFYINPKKSRDYIFQIPGLGFKFNPGIQDIPRGPSGTPTFPLK